MIRLLRTVIGWTFALPGGVLLVVGIKVLPKDMMVGLIDNLVERFWEGYRRTL